MMTLLLVTPLNRLREDEAAGPVVVGHLPQVWASELRQRGVLRPSERQRRLLPGG